MSRCCIYCRIGGTANEPNQIATNSQLELLRKAAEDCQAPELDAGSHLCR